MSAPSRARHWSRLAAAVGFFSLLWPLAVYPAEPTNRALLRDEWVDADTGHRIVRLSRVPGNSESFYFHQNAFTAEGDKMVFANTTPGTGSRLFVLDLAKRQSEPLTEPGVRGGVVGRTSRRVYYQRQGALYATHLDTQETKLIARLPPRWGVVTINSGETLAAGAFTEPGGQTVDTSGPKSSWFDKVFEAKRTLDLFTVELATGRTNAFYRRDAWLNHVQFSPTDPGLLMFCHEGPWHKLDRIWTIRTDGSGLRLMHHRTVPMEIAGHEFWSPDGKRIWFDLQVPRGKEFFLAGVDVATGKETHYPLKRDEWSVHYNISHDQRLFAGDGGSPNMVAKATNGKWIWLFTPQADGTLHSERLVNMARHDYKSEPNVNFTPDGKWIVFRGNFDGSAQVYAVEVAKAATGKLAAKPLFRDPVYDGAADPVVVYNRQEKSWFMFYTNRRASATNAPGVSWVHGTRIGIAESRDEGATWQYRGVAQIPYGEGEFSHWAPEVTWHAGLYHMFVTYVPGMHTDWSGTRDIVHLTSTNLLQWHSESVLKLASDRVIDPCVLQLPDGSWRLWYNDEPDHKSIYYADSPDLYHWQERGKAIGDRPGEGPKVFRWHDRYWMVVDNWQGLGVYHSGDALHWTRQSENLLAVPGQGTDDQVKGGHPDVVVSAGRAFLFYFTHPGRRGADAHKDAYEQRRTSLQVVELQYSDGVITCDRDQPTYIRLLPPNDAEAAVNPVPRTLPALFLIGDSTVRNHTRGQLGWGDPLANWFDPAKLKVFNRALGGRSSRTFLTEGLWKKVVDELKLGDFVLMQFGHNDGGSLTNSRGRASLKGVQNESQVVTNKISGVTETVHTYGWYLRQYIEDTKAKGATPIVLSLVPRKIWKDGKIVRGRNDYAKWAAEAAQAEGVDFVDLNDIVARHYEELGPDKVNALFGDEHTHTNEEGAKLNAQCVVEGLRALPRCSLVTYLAESAAGGSRPHADAREEEHSASAPSPAPPTILPPDYAIGADFSFLKQAEEHGAVFKDNGAAKSGLKIFRDHGYNWIRLRLFHTPTRLPNNQEYTMALAQEAKKLGFKFLLDFHYSDTWADPAKQFIPKAWEGKSHAELVQAVFEYTRDTIAAFRQANVLPDMVQPGNEIIHGMLWPDGKLPDHWDNFAELVKAGIRGIEAGRGDGPRPRILIHIDRGGDAKSTKWFFDKLNSYGVEYDVIGQSYYPWWHGSLLDLRENLAFMANTYTNDIIVVEAAYNWRPTEYRTKPAPFPETPEGQKEFLEEVNRLVLAAPHQRGKGVFWWEPAVAGGLRSRGMFDNESNALPVITVFDKWNRR